MSYVRVTDLQGPMCDPVSGMCDPPDLDSGVPGSWNGNGLVGALSFFAGVVTATVVIRLIRWLPDGR